MWIIEQDCRSATCQLARLADTAMLVLKWISITVTHGKQVLHRCPRWPLPGMGASLVWTPIPPPKPALYVTQLV